MAASFISDDRTPGEDLSRDVQERPQNLHRQGRADPQAGPRRQRPRDAVAVPKQGGGVQGDEEALEGGQVLRDQAGSLQGKTGSIQSHRNGKFYGYQFWKDETKDEHPHRFNGLSKRGVWKFDLGKFEEYTTDNGITYTRKDYEAFYQTRGVGQPIDHQFKTKEEKQEDSDDD